MADALLARVSSTIADFPLTQNNKRLPKNKFSNKKQNLKGISFLSTSTIQFCRFYYLFIKLTLGKCISIFNYLAF